MSASAKGKTIGAEVTVKPNLDWFKKVLAEACRQDVCVKEKGLVLSGTHQAFDSCLEKFKLGKDGAKEAQYIC